MNRIVAYELLTAELNNYRGLAHGELQSLLGERVTRMIRGKDNVDYEIATTVDPSAQDANFICVHTAITEAAWGAPYDQLAHAIEVAPITKQAGASVQ
jgi:hypothetical protein